MTVANTGSRNQYAATASQTVFPYTFKVFSADDITVKADGVVVTGYTVSGVENDNGGNITFSSGRTAGEIITIYRDMDLERLVDYQPSGDFLAEDVNDDFDRLWLAIQQLTTSSSLSIRAPLDDSVLTSSNTELANVATRGGKALGFNADGTIAYLSMAVPTGTYYYVSTVAAAQALTGLTAGTDVVEIAERANAKFDVIASTTNNGYDVLDGTGSGVSLRLIAYDGIPVESYGVKFDGSDGTLAMQASLDGGYKLTSQTAGTVIITSQLDWQSSFSGVEGETVFKMDGAYNNMIQFDGSGVVIEGVVFSGNNSDGSTEADLALCRITEGASIKFSRCAWKDIKGYTNNQYGIEFSAENTDVEFDFCDFENITSTGGNPPAEGSSPGFCGGIFMQLNSAPTVASRLIVSNCLFKDIFTTRNPAYAGGLDTDFDSDAIRLFVNSADHETTPNFECVIENCRFIDVEKRAVKNSGVHGLSVNNIYVKATSTADATRPHMASVISLQPARSCTIESVHALGKFAYLFRITSSDTKISNIFYDYNTDGYCYYAFGMEDRSTLAEGETLISNCHLIGVHRLFRAIDNTGGTGSSYEISNVTMENIKATYSIPSGFTSSTDAIFYLANTVNFKAFNIDLDKGDETYIDANGFELERAVNTSIVNCKILDIGEKLMYDANTVSGSATASGLDVKYCEFSRSGEVDPTDHWIELSATFENAKFKDNTFTIYSTSSNTNWAALRFDGEGDIYDCRFYTYDYSANPYLPFALVVFNADLCTSKNCIYENFGTETPIFFQVSANNAKIIGCYTNETIVSTTGTGDALINNLNPSGKTITTGAGTWSVSANNNQY